MPSSSRDNASIHVTEVIYSLRTNNQSLSTLSPYTTLFRSSIASLLANDTAGTNESGQTLTLTAVGSPVGGAVSFDATNVYFTPAADFNGAAKIGRAHV